MTSRSEWLSFRRRYLKGKKNHEGYYVCEIGGEWTKYPEVDHIIKRSLAPHRVLDETNLRVLCSMCHLKVNRDYSIGELPDDR